LLEESELSYNPEIIFQLTPGNDLIVSDNGFGMDKDIIENYLTRVGRSFYTSPDFLKKKSKFYTCQ
jgi:HSP90 family molecular chaperone